MSVQIGDVVLYTPADHDNVIPRPTGQRCAAIVAHVFSPDIVNLAVFGNNGQAFSRQSVPLVTEEDEKHPGGYYAEHTGHNISEGGLDPQLVSDSPAPSPAPAAADVPGDEPAGSEQPASPDSAQEGSDALSGTPTPTPGADDTQQSPAV